MTPTTCSGVLLQLAATVAASSSSADFAAYSPATLKRMVYVRGVSCDGCTEDQYRKLAEESQVASTVAVPRALRLGPLTPSRGACCCARLQDLPIDEERGIEYDEYVAYRAKADKLEMTRVDFVHQMTTTDGTIDEKRADRMWAHFRLQLESGGVSFLENGTMKFTYPVTHYVAPYLPEVVADAIESGFLASRSVYLRLPWRYRRRLEARAEHFIDSGAMYVVIALMMAILVVDMGGEALERLRRRGARGDGASKEE